MTLRSRVETIRDAIRTQLWPAPTVGVAVALVAGFLLPVLDRAIDGSLPDGIQGYLFGGGASAARTVLDSVAGSLITVTSLTFSLTVVTLQLASSQFSPRLLRTFTRDRFVHFTLALFLATFVYALTVLRAVRSSGDQQAQFVPQISVTVAFVLAVSSVVALVLFLAHLAREIRVETMVSSVHRDASATVERLLSERSATRSIATKGAANNGAATKGVGVLDHSPLVAPSDASLILAECSGFLTLVDHRALAQEASQADQVVLVERPAGVFVVAGTPIGTYWRRPGSTEQGDTEQGDTEQKDVEAFRAALPGIFTIGTERNETQDYSFGLRQLTDVTVKALSPGVNDPTTAVHSLGHTAALMCEFTRRRPGDLVHRDDDGQVRVVCRRPSFAALLDEAVSQPRRYGASDPAVMARLLELLREVAWSVSVPEHRAAVAAQLDRMQDTIAAQQYDQAERDALGVRARRVQAALEHRWSADDLL